MREAAKNRRLRRQIGGQSDRQRHAPWLQLKGCGRWRRGITHLPHTWLAGIYYPAGDIDGYLVQCPGVAHRSEK